MPRGVRTLFRPLLWATLLLAAVQGRPFAQPAEPCASSTRAGFGTQPSIACPVLPESPYIAVPVNAPQQASIYEDWAWKSFVAANWPAIPPPPLTTTRGVPDKTKTFAMAANDAQGVWETWKEKRELFVQGGVPNTDWNAPIAYPGNVGIPTCPGEEAAVAALGPSHRLFAQAGKSLSLDESLQVPSESGPQTTVAGRAVQPQVWHGVRTASGENSVLYEVKFNYDYFTYVVGQGLYDDTKKNQRRMNSGDVKNFPNHPNQSTKAISMPGRDQAQTYNASSCAAKPDPAGQACATTGAVQAKAAWRRITESEKPRFHWTSGLYYRNTGGDKVCKAVATFGLIGLHIIQKTVPHGHYIYATWEHRSVSTDLFSYAEKPVPPKGAPQPPMAPPFPDAIKVSRDHAILPSTQRTTDTYHDLIRRANPASVWLNYHMVGVQFIPVGCWGRNNQPCAAAGFQVGLEDPTNNGQPFYLANLVIETNWGLQNFQGVPPGPPGPYSPVMGFTTTYNTKPTDHFFPNPRPPGEFDRSLGNVGQSRRNRGEVFNMGGCMGCHGVAQALGTDFSFALLFGQQGAGAEAANSEQPLGPPSFGSDVSIQNNRFGPNQFLGLSAQNEVVVTSGPAQQQFVLINPGNPSSLAPLMNGNFVAVRSTTLGGYLLATDVVGFLPWFKVQLAPSFSDSATRWAIQTVPPATGPLKPGDRFCLRSLKPGITRFLSPYPMPDKVGVVDRCTPAEHWTLQQPFAPPN